MKVTSVLCPTELWSLCCLCRGVIGPSLFAPQSYEAMQPLPRKIIETECHWPKKPKYNLNFLISYLFQSDII